jgi:5,6-dimethylbenzimidazole synthase
MDELNVFPPDWRRGVYEVIERRRDVRSFRPDAIPPDTLARILSAAHHAGSVGFSQPWNFIVIDDLELRRRIHSHVDAERLRAAESFAAERRKQYLSFKLEGILDAPLNLCVTCHRTRSGPAIIGRNTIYDTDVYSTCTAIQNLWLAARAEGVGVGWVSILKPEWIRQILAIPDHVVVVAYLCVGYPVEFRQRPLLEEAGWLPRLPLSELVFSNGWDSAPNQELESALRALESDAPGEVAGHIKDEVRGPR